MQAIQVSQVGGPEVLTLTDLPVPSPKPNEALVEIKATGVNFIGHYRFERQNQIILAYHVPATGVITLGEELSEYKRIAPEKARYWPVATGLALRDWLRSRGFDPQAMELPAKPN